MQHAYLQLDKIQGESNDKGHEKWIEIESFHQRITQPKSATSSSAGGNTVARCEHADMVFTKVLDLASPPLYQACSGGDSFKKVLVHFMRADGAGNRVNYLELTLENAIIASVETRVDPEGLPHETIGFRYGKATWKYTQQAIGGGSAGNTQASWNLNTNSIS